MRLHGLTPSNNVPRAGECRPSAFGFGADIHPPLGHYSTVSDLASHVIVILSCAVGAVPGQGLSTNFDSSLPKIIDFLKIFIGRVGARAGGRVPTFDAGWQRDGPELRFSHFQTSFFDRFGGDMDML